MKKIIFLFFGELTICMKRNPKSGQKALFDYGGSKGAIVLYVIEHGTGYNGTYYEGTVLASTSDSHEKGDKLDGSESVYRDTVEDIDIINKFPEV